MANRTGQSIKAAGSGRRLLRHGGSEHNTEALTKIVMDAFDADRERLLAEWAAEPARSAATSTAPTFKDTLRASIVERRAAKAQADLERWQRKLKLAQGKVRKYKARVRYYERKAVKP